MPPFTAALFTVAKIRKQLECLLLGEWTKKMGYTYAMECHSTLKTDIVPSVTQWMNLEVSKLNKLETKTNIA